MPRAQRCVAARTRPCRGAPDAVSWSCLAVSQRALAVSQRALAVLQAVSRAQAAVSWAPSGHDTKTISLPNSCRAHYAPCRSLSWLCRSTLLSCRRVVSQPCCAILRHKRSPLTTIQFLVSRLTPDQVMHVCAHRSPLRPGRPCRGDVSCTWLVVSQPCCAPQHAPARSYHGLVLLLCHNTICCIVTKAGKWAVAHPVARKPFSFSFFSFFFTHFFFSFCSTYWKTTKNIYIFF